MTFNINLKELAKRESEKVEWKENGDDERVVVSIVKTISAFSNDIANFGGGYVICGAKETKDEYGFKKLVFTGLNANKLRQLLSSDCINYLEEYYETLHLLSNEDVICELIDMSREKIL